MLLAIVEITELAWATDVPPPVLGATIRVTGSNTEVGTCSRAIRSRRIASARLSKTASRWPIAASASMLGLVACSGRPTPPRVCKARAVPGGTSTQASAAPALTSSIAASTLAAIDTPSDEGQPSAALSDVRSGASRRATSRAATAGASAPVSKSLSSRGCWAPSICSSAERRPRTVASATIG